MCVPSSSIIEISWSFPKLLLLSCLFQTFAFLYVFDVGFLTFVPAGYWNGSFMNHLRSCVIPRAKIVWWNRCERSKSILDFDFEFSPTILQLTCIYLFRLGYQLLSQTWCQSLLTLLSWDDHYPCWNCWWLKHQGRCLAYPLWCSQSCPSLPHLERSMPIVCSVFFQGVHNLKFVPFSKLH